MSSTNKTTNYNLSQFLGSDKPAWLADYNQDMSKIDTQMKANADSATGADGKADANTTKIGDLTYLSTTAKNNLVAAINEVDSNTDTAQGTATSASSTANQALTLATNLETYLNLGATNKTLTTSDITVSSTGSLRTGSELHIVGNNDNSLIKIYGNIFVNNISSGSNTSVTISNTGLSPDEDITINSCGFITKEKTTGVVFVDDLNFTIHTDGRITIDNIPNGDNPVLGFKFIACVIFLKNFGD